MYGLWELLMKQEVFIHMQREKTRIIHIVLDFRGIH